MREILLHEYQPLLPEKFGFKSQYFDLPGLKMHAAVAGPKDGPLVILLHGFPEFWYTWRRQIPALAAAGLRVVAPDQRGYNLSAKSGPYDTPTLLEDVTALIRACGREQAFVAGHDWGAAVAWSLAIRHPKMVRKLAILNVPHPGVMLRALSGGSLRQMLKSWYIFFFQIPYVPEWLLRRRDYAPMRRMLRGSAGRSTFTSADLGYLTNAWSQPGALSASIGWYRALGRAAHSGKGRALAQKVSPPTLILWGERDVALDVSLAVQSTAWCQQGQLVRYPQASHFVHEDLPEEINKQLTGFFTPE